MSRRTGQVALFENCIPVMGDQPSALIHWNDTSDLGAGANQSTTLNIWMHQAELFGLELGDQKK